MQCERVRAYLYASMYLHVFWKKRRMVTRLHESRHSGTRRLAVGNFPSVELRKPGPLKYCKYAAHQEYEDSRTVLCVSPEHFNGIELAVKSWQAQAYIPGLL